MTRNTQTTKILTIKKFPHVIIIVALALFLFGCNESQKQEHKATEMNNNILPLSDEVRQAILKIKDHRILFAHHSVGANILDGLKALAEETGADFKIERTGSAPLTINSKFVDFSPGQNTNPKSKIDGFAEQIKKLTSDYTPEIAFLKFCYIDFPPDANVEDISDYYKKQIEALKKEKPEITFVHFTVPLTKRPIDPKNRMKRLLGLQVWGDASNVARNQFNNLLLKTFPQDPIFDIALIESTRLDGSRVKFTHDEKTYYCLAPEYTNDGGHLNDLGKRIVASEMVKFLAKTLADKEVLNKKITIKQE